MADEVKNSLFICPVCALALTRAGRVYACASGHSYDISSSGHVNLLTANKKNSKNPGDDKEMAQARRRFLSGGYYAPLREKLAEKCVELSPKEPVLIDSGCGEGYYTAGICAALASAGKKARVAGIDISKECAKRAGKAAPDAEIAVASAFSLPIGGGSADILVNCFSPLCLEEFTRVLRPGGIFIYVVPGAEHLWSLKKVLYDEPYPNEEKLTPYEGFEYIGVESIDYVFTLPDKAAIADLFGMTPYFWKTPRSGAERLKLLDTLDVEASFRLHIFKKTAE